MTVSEAQKRASAKYEREKVRKYILKFYPSDYELLDYLRTKENMAGFLKDAIRADMEKNGICH